MRRRGEKGEGSETAGRFCGDEDGVEAGRRETRALCATFVPTPSAPSLLVGFPFSFKSKYELGRK